MALYAEDATHTSPKIRTLHPETGGKLVGHAALTRWWTDAIQRLPRLRNDDITSGFNEGRATLDTAKRKEAYAKMQRGLADQVPYLWLNRSEWREKGLYWQEEEGFLYRAFRYAVALAYSYANAVEDIEQFSDACKIDREYIRSRLEDGP